MKWLFIDPSEIQIISNIKNQTQNNFKIHEYHSQRTEYWAVVWTTKKPVYSGIQHINRTKKKTKPTQVERLQSWVGAFWLSSPKRWPTRIVCLRNFSAHRKTQVSSCFCRVLRVNESTQSTKHLSTSELYILKLSLETKVTVN